MNKLDELISKRNSIQDDLNKLNSSIEELQKIQLKIENKEKEIDTIQNLLNSKNNNIFLCNTYETTASQEASYILQGTQYEVTVDKYCNEFSPDDCQITCYSPVFNKSIPNNILIIMLERYKEQLEDELLFLKNNLE